MQKLKYVCVAAGSTLAAISSIATAHAADLGSARPEAFVQPYEAAPHRQFYVRGDVGVGQFNFGDFSQAELSTNGGSFVQRSMSDTVMIGAGIGWQLNQRFRFDLTGEYRATSRIKALDNITAATVNPVGTFQGNTLYDGNLSSYVGLANVYWDMFNWRGFTPYIGGGVGFAYHKMEGFTSASSATLTDATTGAQALQLSNGTSDAHTQLNFAWALMAGTSYDLSPNAKLDIGYRYTNLGSGVAVATSLIDCVCGSVGQPLKISDLETHEIRVGVRWLLGSEPRYAEYQPLK